MEQTEAHSAAVEGNKETFVATGDFLIYHPLFLFFLILPNSFTYHSSNDRQLNQLEANTA